MQNKELLFTYSCLKWSLIVLLNFSVENFMCFAEEATFSMVPAKDSSHPNHLLCNQEGSKNKALRASAIYGANAHGKTKLVDAISFARKLILVGTKPKKTIAVSAFRLDNSLRKSPSVFEFVFSHKNAQYTYGFSLDKFRVHEEWLSVKKTTKEVTLFERKTNTNRISIVEPGPSFIPRRSVKRRAFISFVTEGMRANQLFLTEAIDRNISELNDAIEWFTDVLETVSATSLYSSLGFRVSKEKDFTQYIGNFLKNANTGIDRVISSEEPLDFDKHFSFMPSDAHDELRDDLEKGIMVNIISPKGESLSVYKNKEGIPTVAKLKGVHIGSDGNDLEFDFSEESAGTKRLLHLLPILADLQSKGKVYVIDELDRKLHPILSKLFVSTYLESNCSSGQLIFTTHDTHLLDLDLLRRDEIWFVEKDHNGGSHLYSLMDMKVRSDINIQNGYLKGRFGGIPFVGDPQKLCWDENNNRT